jgi:hypothetical protein
MDRSRGESGIVVWGNDMVLSYDIRDHPHSDSPADSEKKIWIFRLPFYKLLQWLGLSSPINRDLDNLLSN